MPQNLWIAKFRKITCHLFSSYKWDVMNSLHLWYWRLGRISSISLLNNGHICHSHLTNILDNKNKLFPFIFYTWEFFNHVRSVGYVMFHACVLCVLFCYIDMRQKFFNVSMFVEQVMFIIYCSEIQSVFTALTSVQ